MKTLQIEVPDDVEIESRTVEEYVATLLYQKGTLTLGQAAEMLRLTKWEFMDMLKEYNVSVINHPASDIIEDLKNA